MARRVVLQQPGHLAAIEPDAAAGGAPLQLDALDHAPLHEAAAGRARQAARQRRLFGQQGSEAFRDEFPLEADRRQEWLRQPDAAGGIL